MPFSPLPTLQAALHSTRLCLNELRVTNHRQKHQSTTLDLTSETRRTRGRQKARRYRVGWWGAGCHGEKTRDSPTCLSRPNLTNLDLNSKGIEAHTQPSRSHHGHRVTFWKGINTRTITTNACPKWPKTSNFNFNNRQPLLATNDVAYGTSVLTLGYHTSHGAVPDRSPGLP